MTKGCTLLILEFKGQGHGQKLGYIGMLRFVWFLGNSLQMKQKFNILCLNICYMINPPPSSRRKLLPKTALNNFRCWHPQI